MKSRSSSPASNACITSSWLSKTSAGASMTWCSGLTAETLITARPRVPSSSCSPPVADSEKRHRVKVTLREKVACTEQGAGVRVWLVPSSWKVAWPAA